MSVNDGVDFIQNGENIDETVLNRPITGLGDNVDTALALKVNNTRTITAGNGLTGGGNLTANRTITLGTPGTLTLASGNSVTSGSHTHALNIADATTTTSGLMSASDKSKLNSTTAGAVAARTAGDTLTGALAYNGTSKSSGVLYGGTANPTNTTRVNYDGNLHAFTFIEPSDIRMKEDLTVIQDATEIVKSLNGYKFTMKESRERKVGLIAQEVLEVLPEAVKGSEETGYGLAYGDLVGLLVQTIKEMDKRIQDLESK